MKKVVSFILIVVFVLSLISGCGISDDSVKYYGDEVSNETLRICIDCTAFDSSPTAFPEHLEKLLENLVEELKSSCGIEKVVFEILPDAGTERDTVLQRLRTEIMAGGGPDVFFMETNLDTLASEVSAGLSNRQSLFIFPEKNMESGVFLPLDDYMTNSTQFTDWSKQTKAVMEAGRSDEGQVIIPLTYTMPIWVYPKNEVDPSVSEMSMWEILENRETAGLGAVLYSSKTKTDNSDHQFIRLNLPFMLGRLADYETEKLLFTEDELYSITKTSICLQDDIEEQQLTYLESGAEYDLICQINLQYFDTEMTLVPLYSKNGGVTASIRSYAAINRNTKLPKEAFSVIDYIMQEDMQRSSDFYSSCFVDGLPMQHDLGQQGKSLRATSNPERVLAEPYFEDLLKIKEQITDVNFQTGLDSVLRELMDTLTLEYDSGGGIQRKHVTEAYERMERMMGE